MTLNYESPAGYTRELPPAALLNAITPLRRIFWGAMLVIFDLSFKIDTNGTGFKFDILNDALGMLLICLGVFKLARLPVSPRYVSMMTFIKIVAVLQLIAAVDEHFIYTDPPGLGLLRALVNLAGLVAVLLFCTAMHDLARRAALNAAADSWKVTRLLYFIIYVIPLGILYLSALAAVFGASPFNLHLGAMFLPLILVFIIPPIHFFVSTSRLKRGLESLLVAI